jgi:hypothetical protein
MRARRRSKKTSRQVDAVPPDRREALVFNELEPSDRSPHTDLWLAIARTGTKIGTGVF